MERPSGGGVFLAGVGLDGDFEGGHVEVDAAVLEFFCLVDAPGRLPGDAEGGVVENDEEFATLFKMTCGIGNGKGVVFDVLEHEEEGSVRKGGMMNGKGFCDIADEEGEFRSFFGIADERGRGVDADVVDLFRDVAAQNALPTAEVEKRVAAFEVEKSERIGEDDLFVVIVPLFADNRVVPFM